MILVIRATNCKLKSVVARITTHLKHCHATKCCCSKLKLHVAASWTGVYFYELQITLLLLAL